MAAVPFIVPTLSPSGALHFAAVDQSATSQDIIDALSVLDDVQKDILGDLPESGWAIQRIRKHDPGTTWDANALTQVGNGILSATEHIGPLIASTKPPSLQRHFSAFPLSSHLHTPSIRLVSLHPSLCLTLSTLRIPDVDDDLEFQWFLARGTTVEEVMNGVVEEMGLSRVITGPGGGVVEYVLEEAWIAQDGKEASTRLSGALIVSHLLEEPVQPSPFPARVGAKRVIRICVPDEWYRRSKSRSLSLAPIEGGDTIQDVSSNERANDEEEGGTAKQRPKGAEYSQTTKVKSKERHSHRFSLFDGWGTISSPTTSNGTSLSQTLAGDRNSISVSAPVAMLSPQETGLGIGLDKLPNLSEADIVLEFEKMMDELGLKDSRREAMRKLPLERKQYLIHQSKQTRHVVQALPSADGSSSPKQIASPISPQITGGLMKRFSLWGSAAPSPSTSTPPPVQESAEPGPEALPIVPQITGSLWGNWWSSGSREGEKPKEVDRSQPQSAEWFVDGIRNGKATDSRLAKHLISLRVHLSTAKVTWVERFLEQEKGMDALSDLLQSLVGRGGKRRKLGDTEETVLLEVVKCLRVLLNTAPGYPYVLRSPTLITNITFTLHNAPVKLRALSSDLLAAICVISLNEGHRLVLGALSDYMVCFEESFRFEDLIRVLRVQDGEGDQDGEMEGTWEARSATMGLLIALTSCSDTLEERVMIREELSRRGLNETIVALKYVKPPETLLKQLEAYVEEKFEDEEDLREQVHSTRRRTPSSNSVSSDDSFVLRLLRIKDMYPDTDVPLDEIIASYESLFTRDIPLSTKLNILRLSQAFMQSTPLLEDLDRDWESFVDQFSTVVQSIISKSLTSSRPRQEENSKELAEALAKQVEELSTKLQALQIELTGQTVELETLRSLSQTLGNTNASSKPAGKGGVLGEMRGLVPRLVQKEKEVARLQVELERAKSALEGQKSDPEEQMKKERERAKIKKLVDEIDQLKAKNIELESTIATKIKEVTYLKRALESVYSRFHANTSERTGQDEGRNVEVDVQAMANHTIEGLSKKEEEIKLLSKTVDDLRAQLNVLQATPLETTALEKQFKARVPPPPPPSSKPKKNPTIVVPATPVTSSQTQPIETPVTNVPSTEPPPTSDMDSIPIPPPPPRSMVTSFKDAASDIPLAPPPPNIPTTQKLDEIPVPPPLPRLNSPSASNDIPIPPPLPGLVGAISIDDTSFLPPPPPPPFLQNIANGAGPAKALFKRPGNPSGPVKKLKPFFWTKLAPAKVHSTIWSDVEPSSIELDLTEIEDIFTVDNSASTKSSRVTLDGPKSTAVTTLLDITRANNIAIMLSRIKLSNGEIRQSLLEIDDSKLSTDDLKAISKQLPTQEELGRIRDFGDLSKLAKADQYFGELMHIPRLSERLDCLIYRRKLELELAELKPDLDMVRNAGAEVKGSKKLKQVLGVVLAVGNALNGSTFRGGARGFQLEALLKMKETKTAKVGSDCPTLLHYLAKVLMRTDTSLVLFIEDLPHVEPAARVSVQFILSNVNSLYQGLSRVQEELEIAKATPRDPSDHFTQVMGPFLNQMQSTVESLKLSGQMLDSELKDMLFYFAEATDTAEATKPEDFFNLILSFSSALQKAALDLHDSQAVAPRPAPSIKVEVSEDAARDTVKRITPAASTDNLTANDPNRTPPATQGQAAGNWTVGRGDVDLAIHSIRQGQRRARPNRPLSKIFLDGAGANPGPRPVSRVYD
ncbi:FH2-domain-containing protein [Serendipita vermifera]|nr:FH2-domain-containing protein [Serendipita vermifera]